MKKVFHLKTCSTCQRIIKGIKWPEDISFQNIKEQHIDAEALDLLADHIGGYEALFNKRAVKYRSQGLKEKTLSDLDFRKLILEEYSFLKRPVIVYAGHYFIGNAKSEVKALEGFFNKK